MRAWQSEPPRGDVVAGSWPAAAEAARLLAAVGRRARVGPQAIASLRDDETAVHAPPSSVEQDWTRSGATALTGRADGPPLAPRGRPATVARAASLAFELITGATVDGPALLVERAALMGLTRAGQVSAGGSTRLLRSDDGWWALNLARDDDLVPALVSRQASGDPWAEVAAWARTRPVAEIVERASLLGMAAAGLGETQPPSSPWRMSSVAARTSSRRRPRVVNLGALWAAPLCAHLLYLAGAEVVDVESSVRPDPSRTEVPEFFARLHDGHDRRVVDFADAARLREELRSADVVIAASRPRALTALGIDAPSIMTDGQARTWLHITGHRDPHRIAFGDDAAVAGGLVAWDGEEPVFCGDAIADPLTGLLSALAIAATHSPTRSTLIEIALAEVAAYCAAQ